MIFSKHNKENWFTLIELVISIAIMSIIIVSVMDIFILSNDISYKADINRNMQKNIKNVVETIAEDLRKNWASSWTLNAWVWDGIWNCNLPTTWTKYLKWEKLCTNSLNKYYLAIETAGTYQIVDDETKCLSLNNVCRIVVSDSTGLTPQPLSNDSVTFTNLAFYITDNDPTKITISFIARPSAKKWVKAKLIKDNIINFQTTITERFIKNY